MSSNTSTSSLHRYSTSNHITNSSDPSDPVTDFYHHRRDWDKERSSYDRAPYDDDKFKKTRTPSPPLSPDRIRRPRFTKKTCLLMTALTIGILLPLLIVTTGVITLESFNDVVRYLPGYNHFANNLLYLVMLLLLVSFSALATLPIPSIFILCLPFHLLIFSIFNKLMSEWVNWCIGSYATLSLAPVGYTVIVRIRSAAMQSISRRDPTPSHSPSSVHIKYSPLQSGLVGSNSISFPQSLLGQFRRYTVAAISTLERRLEDVLYIFSVSNRTSTLWRLLLALVLWFSYVIPVSISNESRYFDPSQSAPSFDILHPEPLCSARHLNGNMTLHDSFDGYWNEYLDLHRRIMLPEEKGGVPQERKRYLIFQPSDDGLGNRLQALLSTVVLAMVTKRAIVLDWMATPQCNANFTDLFQAPDNLDWDFLTKFPDHKDLKEYEARYQLWYPYCRGCALRSPITPDSTWSDLLCDHNLGLYETSPFVQVTSTQWFLPVIQHNPYWRQVLCDMFPDGGKNAFEILAKKLLRPSRAVQGKIDSVLDRVPDDVTLIGLQVRRTENNAVDSSIEDSFLSCAEQVAEEEEDTFLEAWRTGSLRSQAGREFNRNRRGSGDSDRSTGVQRNRMGIRDSANRNARASRPKFAYYLATDYRPTRAHFQKILGDQLFVLDNTFQVHKSSSSSLALIPSSNVSGSESPGNHPSDLSGVSDNLLLSPSPPTSSAQREAVVRNSVEGVQTAVAEMFLLAQSDRIIMSPYSTFGYFAHAHANVQPNIVKRDGTCVKRKSTQPCFQYWFGFANGGAKCNIRSTVEMSEDYDCWL